MQQIRNRRRRKFITKDVPDIDSALEGARHIIMEEVSESAELTATLREYFWNNAHLISKLAPDQSDAGGKFADYSDYSECISKIPSHRALALLRGQKEGVLRLSLELPQLDKTNPHPCVVKIVHHLQVPASASWLQETLRWCWRVKFHTRI